MNVTLLSEEEKERYKKAICEDLWLKYFNRTLHNQGVITEREYLKMNTLIVERTQRLLKWIEKGIRHEKSGTDQHHSSLPNN